MPNILKNMAVRFLGLQPPIEKAVRLSEDMQQTLSLLCAYGIDERKVLRASESGVLNVTSARIKDMVHFTGSGANDEQTGDDISCTECLIMAHPDNVSKVWVRPSKVATVNNAWPLDANDVMSFALDNLKQLNMLIVGDGEKVIAAYTR
jgi:hypothetical protein